MALPRGVLAAGGVFHGSVLRSALFIFYIRDNDVESNNLMPKSDEGKRTSD